MEIISSGCAGSKNVGQKTTFPQIKFVKVAREKEDLQQAWQVNLQSVMESQHNKPVPSVQPHTNLCWKQVVFVYNAMKKVYQGQRNKKKKRKKIFKSIHSIQTNASSAIFILKCTEKTYVGLVCRLLSGK